MISFSVSFRKLSIKTDIGSVEITSAIKWFTFNSSAFDGKLKNFRIPKY